ncbi:transposable element Tcb1 transposase [Trichonephila clavipes]|nr:transposable element Tcb1 transposase [Trichonephila clavipes]
MKEVEKEVPVYKEISLMVFSEGLTVKDEEISHLQADVKNLEKKLQTVEKTTSQTPPCPDRSSYLSQIEHVLDRIGRRLQLPRNVDDLARQLEQVWQEIPQETIRVLYHSMPRRVAVFIQVRAIRERLATDLVIFNYGQTTRTTPELASRLLTTPPQPQEDV